MKFSEFCTYLTKLESISSRNEMVVVVAELYNKLGDDVAEATYLLQGRVAPLFLPIEFSFSGKSLLKAFAVKFSKTKPAEMYKKLGDFGLLAEQLLGKSKSAGPSIKQVHASLTEITAVQGKNSQTTKQGLFLELLAKLSAEEAKYVCRIIIGTLRLGLSDKTVLDSFSWMISGDKSLRAEIEYAFGVNADLGAIATVLKQKGIEELKKISAQPGIPIAVKLVEREKTVADVFDRFGKCIVQAKYDGLRAEVHFSRKGFKSISTTQTTLDTGSEQVRIFSRRMESLTSMLTDVAAAVSKFKVDSIILDGEAIGYDPKTGANVQFQETMKRKRKFDIEETAKGIPLKVFCFDILLLNGRDLLKTPLQERLAILKKVLAENKSETFVYSESPVVDKVEVLQQKFDEYVEQGLEGMIVKGLDTIYEPGTRNYDWVKLKAASQSHLADSVDAVVLGYYAGAGQRAKFGIGAILIGYYNDKTGKFYSLAKVGTGIKDEQWKQIRSRLDKIKVSKLPDNVIVDKNLIPDVIVNPEVIVVVESDSISESKIHGGEGGGGYSLRFPRLKEFDRLDKKATETTTPVELDKLFKLQG
jgi:DNA ligase-1